MLPLGLIHHNQHHKAGVFNRKVGNKAGNQGAGDVDAVGGLLGGTGFAANALA